MREILVVAFFDRGDSLHAWAVEQWANAPVPLLTCEAVPSEAAHLLAEHAGLPAERVLALIERGGGVAVPFRLEEHLGPIARLLEKCRDQGMQLADACLVGCRKSTAIAGFSPRTVVTSRSTGALGARRGYCMMVFIGTYTEKTASEGIYTCLFDPRTGALRMAGVARAVNPSFLALAPGGRSLYAVGETAEFRNAPSGAVLSFAVEGGTGKLSPRNAVSSRGTGPCSVAVDATGRWAAAANYRSGAVALFPVLQDGSLGDASDVRQHEGRGAHPERQAGPHAHCVLFDPTNRLLLCADLGMDKVMIYRLDPTAGKLAPHAQPWLSLHAGAGPRHLRFHPKGRHLYVINELDSTLSVFSADAAGRLTEVQSLSTLPPDFRGESWCADVHVAPSGRFLYGSNRGHDSIAVWAVAEGTGTLTTLGFESTRGRTPRNFALDPSGTFLLAANQDTNDVVVFSVDPRSGILSDTGNRLAVPSPVCVLFSA